MDEEGFLCFYKLSIVVRLENTSSIWNLKNIEINTRKAIKIKNNTILSPVKTVKYYPKSCDTIIIYWIKGQIHIAKLYTTVSTI